MSAPKSSVPGAGRRWGQALLGLGLALSAWLLRHAAQALVARRLPGIFGAVFSLLQGPIFLSLLLVGLWPLRQPLFAALRALFRRFQRWEEGLEGRLPTRWARHSVWWRALLVGTVISLLCNGFVELTPVEQGLEANILDRWFGLRFPLRSEAELATQALAPSSLSDVAIVGIDDETIAAYGWPLPRSAYARLIAVLMQAQPKSLSFDVALIEPSHEHPEHDRAVAQATAAAGRVYYTLLLSPKSLASSDVPAGPTEQVRARNLIPRHDTARGLPDFALLSRREMASLLPVSEIAQAAYGLAMANVLLDGDDLLRHSLTVARLGDQLYPSLSLRLAADALDVPLSQVRVLPGSHVDLGGKRRIPIDEIGRTLVRYQGRHSTRAGPVLYLPLHQLLRFDLALTLPGSPLGEDQRFLLGERSKLTVDGRAMQVAVLDPRILRSATRMSGVARYSVDPGVIDELSIITAEATPKAGSAPPVGEGADFEVLDEDHLRFRTQVGSVQALGGAPSMLRERHVFVGSTALAATDVHNGPLGGFPGVEHHATMLSNILRTDFFRPAPGWLRVGETAACGLLAALSGSVLSAGLGAVLAAGLGLLLLLGTFFAFSVGVHIPLVAPASALFLAYALCVFLSLRAEARARKKAEAGREFVRRTFGRYLTDQVVQQILDSPDGLRLGGQRRRVTILMTDLRGFTSMCGSMEPESVVALLNHYLEAMTAIITRYGGTIDEFIGDAILVFFGAPLPHSDDELRAVACAIEMQNAMHEVNAWNRAQGLPAVEMGIGIHCGELVVGNIGSELRAKYGVVGAAINLTSRIESCTVGGQVLLSEQARERCGASLQVGQSQVITPKGVRGTLTIYEALAVAAPYDVTLQQRAEDRHPPAEPLRARCAVIKDKQVGELSELATVIAVSEHSLQLKQEAGTAALASLANLQLRLESSAGELWPGDLYAKVIEAEPGTRTAVLRITSAAAEVAPRWLGICRAAAAKAQVTTSPDAAGKAVLDGPLSSE